MNTFKQFIVRTIKTIFIGGVVFFLLILAIAYYDTIDVRKFYSEAGGQTKYEYKEVSKCIYKDSDYRCRNYEYGQKSVFKKVKKIYSVSLPDRSKKIVCDRDDDYITQLIESNNQKTLDIPISMLKFLRISIPTCTGNFGDARNFEYEWKKTIYINETYRFCDKKVAYLWESEDERIQMERNVNSALMIEWSDCYSKRINDYIVNNPKPERRPPNKI